jgi:DNA-binding MarR family transcriptional regulator/ribosomal protein S18 acetylase RimI-like enzyme
LSLIRELGAAALASRLKSLSDNLLQDASNLYGELGVPFEARWFGFMQVLLRRSPASITEIADELGMTPPAIRKNANQMIARGLIQEKLDPRDERRRPLVLTQTGRSTAEQLAPVWGAFREAVTSALNEAGVDLLGDLARVEEVCSRRSIADRVRLELGRSPQPTLRIVDYRPAYKKHFRSLNLEWIERHFTLEPEDRQVLDNPNRLILKRGGSILFALEHEKVVGTCALVRHRNGCFELTKMAVAPDARRRGIGTRLAREAIRRAQEAGAEVLHLQTSPRLKAACRLYRHIGFRRVRTNPIPRAGYARESITMSLKLPVHV